jgi:hypothetical protein
LEGHVGQDLRGIVACVLGALAALMALSQLGALIAASRTRRGYSFVPLIPAIVGVAACLVAPWPRSGWLLPIAFVLDPTPIMYLAVLVRWISRKLLKRVV